VKADVEKAAVEIDARGLKCPEPVMMLHGAMRRAPNAGLVKLLATDPSTERDVPQFCRFLDHELIETRIDESEALYSFLIRKKG